MYKKIKTLGRQAGMNFKIFFILFFGFSFLSIAPLSAQTQSDPNGPAEAPAAGIKLVQAVMSEDLQERTPQNITTVFTIERRKAICFTAFDPVPEKTDIYHHWFHRDRPSAKLKLTLKPPRWSSYKRPRGSFSIRLTRPTPHEPRFMRACRFSTPPVF